jgi:three-Cys-motif partner protein
MKEQGITKQISKWMCHKLECLADFFITYTEENGNRYYLEPFAGCGSCTCRGTDCVVDDSELRALKAKGRFSKCIFIVRESQDAKNLDRLTELYTAGTIITGNCINEEVLRQAFNIIPRSAASLAFIDPMGYTRLRWSTVRKLARHGSDWQGHKMDLLIIFPLEMALLRNLTRAQCEASINRLYGNRKWQQVRGKRLKDKISRDYARKELVALFKSGLKGLGYRFVGDIKPARFSNPPYYHVIWASDTAGRLRELAEIWKKPRYLPCELFHGDGG